MQFTRIQFVVSAMVTAGVLLLSDVTVAAAASPDGGAPDPGQAGTTAPVQ